MELVVLDINGKDTGRKVQLSDAVFGIEPNEHAIYLDVKRHLANRRQGTHKSKEKGEIKGSTRKLRKQKGSGAARVGSIKSPIFRGGGRVFGPRPRNYSFKLNKNVKRLARKSAFSLQTSNKNIILLENFTFDTPKTKKIIKLLNGLKLNDKKTLLVLGQADNNVYLSARNVQNMSVMNSSELTTYDVLNARKVILLENALKPIEQNLSK